MALLAGNIIACERADRSAEFLAFQGATRGMVITSKMAICIMAYIVISISAFCTGKLLLGSADFRVWGEFQSVMAVTGVVFWGCCWLLSAAMSSPAIAVTLGSIVPAIIMATLAKSRDTLGWPTDGNYERCYVIISAVVGAASLIAGILYYLRRKEP